MVVLLIRMKFAVLRNTLAGKRSEDMMTGGVTGLALAAGTILLATLSFSQPGTSAAVIVLALTTWTLGWMIGPAMFGGGDETLRPEQFALLPVSPRRLAAGLLGASFVGAAPVISLIAFVCLIVFAARLGPAAIAVAVVATPLQLAFAILLSRVATAWLNQVMRTRTGSGLSAVVSAVIMTLAASGWALAPVIGFALSSGFPPGFAATIRALPTGWGVVAIEAAGRSQWPQALAALAGLTVLCGLLVLSWAFFLVRRITSRPAEAGTGSRFSPVRPTGRLTAVFAKELLTWTRDLRRFHFYVFALCYAIFSGLLPLAVGSDDFLPWTGILFAVMAAATSAGLYSEDGTALWTTLMTPGAPAVDVRGRQLAWLAVVSPSAIVLTAVPTVLTGHQDRWPFLLAVLAAVLGAGAGLIVLLSVLRLVPMNDPHVRSGNMMENPSDFGQTMLTLVLVACSAAPILLVTGPAAQIATGLIIGAALAWGLGVLAARRLEERGSDLLQLMRSGPPKKESLPKPKTRWLATFCLTVCWIPLAPQGIVPVVMLLTGNVAPSWFLALHVDPPWQWPIAIGMIAIGSALLVTGAVLMHKKKPR